MNLPILGHINNMAYITCPNCSHNIEMFHAVHHTSHDASDETGTSKDRPLGSLSWSEDAQNGNIEPHFTAVADLVMLAYNDLTDANRHRINIPIKQE